jgi:precorrin-2 dehydrogenase/sirohydrochlorin ferrochelatase
MNELFPIFLKLNHLKTLLVGGGPVGLEKLQALLANSPSAHIKIVAKGFSKETKAFIAEHNHLLVEERSFEERDLEDVDLVILATNNEELNQRIRNFARTRNLLINVADKPALCDFYLGSVVRKGNLKVAISTNGKSPTMAKRLKEFFQDLLPEEIDESLELMKAYRDQLKGDFKYKVEQLNAHTREVLKP